MTIPVWLFVVLSILAAIGAIDRIFAPSVRWFFRRKLNTAIDELNNRLDLRIQPFRLTRQQTLTDQLMYDPQIIAAAEEEAASQSIPISVVMKKAERYAKEIVPSFSPFAYFGFGTKIARILSNSFIGFNWATPMMTLSGPSLRIIGHICHEPPVQSDYVLVTYMASARASLSYAVGEWV